jgi:hypothetical protein
MTQSRDWIDRREFTGKALLALLAGVTVTITGCGADSPTEAAPVTDKSGTIENNHGHDATITSAQQKAGGAVTLNIQGTSSHNHELVLTAAEVTAIRFGERLAKGCATNRNHMHTITFN